MRKLFAFASIFLILGLAALVFGQIQITKLDFLTTGVSCGASATLVNGTDFTSQNVIVYYPNTQGAVAITVTFTRTAGSASTVNFEFQASYDGGTTWTTAYLFMISTATNTTAVSNTVRSMSLVNIVGITHLRLYRIVNGDASNALTLCNATISYRAF